MKTTHNIIAFLFGVFFILFSVPNILHAQIFINEISICNVNQELDPNYDYSGWIELYNCSNTDINIKNLYFSDDSEQPLKYKISDDRILPAQGYAVVWLNDELINSKTGYSLDTDADDGGFLSVADKNGNIYDTMNYGQQYPNISYGRPVDGDTTSPLVYFIRNTFGNTNNKAVTATEVIKTPKISTKSGFYESAVKVKITCGTEGAQIYYTTDASEPTLESTLYTNEITIPSTTVLRARAFKDGCLDGLIATNTYMINKRKPENLPIIFLTTAPENLYDDMIGIYCIGTNGIILTANNPKANYNRDWTRWGYIEFQDEKREVSISQPIGLAISGNASRGYDQKSFKIKGKTKHGKKRFDVPLFPTREGLRYKSFLLRSGGQFSTTVQLVHDACIQSLADVTPLNYQAAIPAVVYLNGEYWGIYNLRERKNKDMIYSYYGLSETDFDMIEFAWGPVVSNGSKENWNKFENIVRSSNFSKNEDYEKICELMDIDNFLYYMSIQIMGKNMDWPNNNQLVFCPHAKGGKWKWILQDLDQWVVGGSPINKLQALIESTSTLLSTKLIVYLLNNEKFKDEYITVQSLVASSVYAPERFKTRLTEMKKAIETEYPYYQEKWPTQGKSELEKTTQNTIKYEALACSQIFDHLKTNFSLGEIHSLNINSTHTGTPILFNKRQIPVLPYDGKWFENKSLHLQAPLYDQGEKFAYWNIIDSDNNIRKQTETSIELSVEKDMQVTAIYESSGMVRRNGIFINEISADNASYVDDNYKYEDWIELYNSSSESIDFSKYYISNEKNNPTMFQFADTDSKKTTIPAGGYSIIWCSKKPERGILHTNFKLSKTGGSVYLSKIDETNEVILVDSVCYASHDKTTSFGRYPDGGLTLYTFTTPSFKSMNQYSIHNEIDYTEDFPLVSNITDIINSKRPVVYKSSDEQIFVQCLNGKNLKIISLNGNVLKQILLTQEESYISIGEYPKGVYLIIVEFDNERWGYKIIR